MQARVTLRRAALTIFGLIAVLPILLFTLFMCRFERLHQTEAQVGVLLAVLIALLGFVLFRQLVDRVANLSRVLESPGHTAAAKPAQTNVVSGLGEVTEIGDKRGPIGIYFGPIAYFQVAPPGTFPQWRIRCTHSLHRTTPFDS